jgi:flagellin-like hook-associated protein FlgL
MNDSLDADSRNDIANELNSILDEAVSIANAKHQDSYLFAGATPPIRCRLQQRYQRRH